MKLYVVQKLLPGNIVDHYGSPIYQFYWATFVAEEAYRMAEEMSAAGIGAGIAIQDIEVPL